MDIFIRILLDLPADEQAQVLSGANSIRACDGADAGTALMRALNAHGRAKAAGEPLPTSMNPRLRKFLTEGV